MYLTTHEFAALRSLPAVEIVKVRRSLEWDNSVFAIDSEPMADDWRLATGDGTVGRW